jgi:hypothetical protein
LHLAVKGCIKRRNENFVPTVSKLLELKANPDVKDNSKFRETAKEFAEKKIKNAIKDYNSDDYDYFKDNFLKCDCASMKLDEVFDVDVIDVDWETCFECEHGPCYFDWSSVSPIEDATEDATEDAENADTKGNADITDADDADGADNTDTQGNADNNADSELSGKSSNYTDDYEVLDPNFPPYPNNSDTNIFSP